VPSPGHSTESLAAPPWRPPARAASWDANTARTWSPIDAFAGEWRLSAPQSHEFLRARDGLKGPATARARC
jgi:hypothetical protein